MSLPATRIALRYLFSKKSHSAVNIISYISIAGIALATAAMIIVLSVFNGFAKFAELNLSRLDPDLTVVNVAGQAFGSADSIAQSLSGIEGVAMASPVIEQRAFAIAGEEQAPVIIRGIAAAGPSQKALAEIIIDGEALIEEYGDVGCAVSSIGVANALRTTPQYPVQVKIYEPKRTGRINPSSPMTAFRVDSVWIAGVYRADRAEYDSEYIYIPLSTARRLLNYTNAEATSIELALAPGANANRVKTEVDKALPAEFKTMTAFDQREDSMKMIAIEKWVTLAMLVFVLLIASFNILSTMSMLIIEKRSNHAILLAMGATRKGISSIYARLSFMITAVGGVIGIVLGLGLSLLQEYGGIIKLHADDMTALSINVYPVSVNPLDLIIVVVTVAVIGGATALLSRFMTVDRSSVPSGS